MLVRKLKKMLGCAFVAGAIFLPLASSNALQTPDQEYEAVAEDFIKGYFAARPLLGTSIGMHEYDGKITDYSRLALDAELFRLKKYEDRLQKFELTKLSQRQSIDLRILQAGIRKEIFQRALQFLPKVHERAFPADRITVPQAREVPADRLPVPVALEQIPAATAIHFHRA